ncbi:MAG TPA: hypothetical protein VIL88_11040 [Devosia sp.]|jgi:hypothetical protein|uniref:hypothetical protein n=1 Tax=Devosia sp. TaxID=1871048 RepID=UPI002F94CEB2
MSDYPDPQAAAELYELYAELHLACGRAAAALRLNGNWDAPHEELLERFRKEEARAKAIWEQIKVVQERSR